MSTCLTILNASGKLSPLRDRIERTYATSIATVAQLLPIADIDVVVMAGKRVIPELGLAGFAPASDLLYITLDPDNENLLPKLDEEFPATLGHELHHCLRHGGPGYGNTLREAIVSEGLACHFETELRNGDAPFYGVHLDSHTLDRLLPRMAPELDTPNYDHVAWFFGSEEKNIPRLAGYCMGYRAVADYVARTGIPASQLWNVDPRSVFGAA